MPQGPFFSRISVSRCRVIMKAEVSSTSFNIVSPEQCLTQSKRLIIMNESTNKLSAWSLAHCHLSTWALLAGNTEEWFWGVNSWCLPKHAFLDFDRYCQIVLYRDWASLHSHQQYVRASVSLTSILMVVSKSVSVNLVVLICISLIMEKVEFIFIYLKAIWDFFPGKCLFVSFAHFQLRQWSFFLSICRKANSCPPFFMSFEFVFGAFCFLGQNLKNVF